MVALNPVGQASVFSQRNFVKLPAITFVLQEGDAVKGFYSILEGQVIPQTITTAT